MPLPLPVAVPRQITRTHLTSLYASYLRASSRFASYNFRSYFLRRSREKFRTELPVVLAGSSQSTGSLDAEGDASASLRKWFVEAKKDLGVLERASVMNRMFEAPKLVVEGRGRVATGGGGGAGMEQATGGAGQPISPGDTIKAPSPPADPKQGL